MANEEPKSPALKELARYGSVTSESDSKKLIGRSSEDDDTQAPLGTNTSNDVKALQGEFFGTDFNFLYSEEMQRALATNCLSANWDSLMNFSQH